MFFALFRWFYDQTSFQNKHIFTGCYYTFLNKSVFVLEIPTSDFGESKSIGSKAPEKNLIAAVKEKKRVLLQQVQHDGGMLLQLSDNTQT